MFDEQQRQLIERLHREAKEKARVEEQLRQQATKLGNPISLKSVPISKPLIGLLWVQIGFYIVELLAYFSVSNSEFLLVPEIIIFFIQTVIFLVWIHHIHTDLKEIFGNYPITPKGAVVRYIFPVIFWGIWNTLSTFANRFQQEGGDLSRIAEKVRTLALWSYVFLIISLTRLPYELSNALNTSGETTPENSPLISFLDIFISIGVTTVDLLIVQTMMRVVKQKAKRQEL